MTATIPFIPETAPFSPDQRAWLNGFLAGLFSESPAPAPGAATATAVEAARPTLTVAFGSQTGNGEGLAKQLLKEAKAEGFAGAVVDLADFTVEQLATTDHFLLITSTYGDGEPPDNAQAFYEALHAESAPSLEGTRYAVFGLGDSNYPDFCQAAVDFDARLAALGAQRLLPRVDCDVDDDDAFSTWRGQILAATAGDGAGAPAATATAPSPAEPAEFGRSKPYPARLRRNLNLNGEGSAKETRHLEIDLGDSGLTYQVGDALGVVPRNDPARVDALLAVVGLDPQAALAVSPGETTTLRDALIKTFDLSKLTLAFAQRIAARGAHAELEALCADRAAFNAFAHGREIIDLLEAYPVSWHSAEEFVGELKRLAPRLYSISSSPKAHAGEVHLTVGRVTYHTHGRERAGVCSDMLAQLSDGDRVDVFVQPNKHFRPPEDPTCPMIMVGPGTGIAPFRAFLEERAATGARGPNWLFFGDQKASCDFLYAGQLEGWQKSGLLTQLDTAFSRDQEQKVYVQDRMREHGAELVRWLDEGAYFFVCGDASRMAKDVDTALREIIAAEKTLSTEEAAAYVDELRSQKRYVRDVY